MSQEPTTAQRLATAIQHSHDVLQKEYPAAMRFKASLGYRVQTCLTNQMEIMQALIELLERDQ